MRIDYDRIAHLYDERERDHDVDPGLIAFLDGREPSPAVRVLDVGCGTGKQLAANRARFPRLTLIGVDRSRAMLTVARKRSTSVSWIHGDAQSLPIASGVVDYAVNQYSYPHIPDKIGFFAELARVLRPGGRFVLTNIDPWSMRDWITYRFFPEAWSIDERDFLRVEILEEVMRSAGFTAVSTTARAETRDESLRAFLHRVSGRHAMSQLTAISEAAYHQGLTRVRARLEAANGADLLIASPMTFITVVGDKP
jgi:SAM-dependent methyltransferase